MKWNKKNSDKLWWIFYYKMASLNPQKRWKDKSSTNDWLNFLSSRNIHVRKSRECFFGFEEVIVLGGFPIRPSYKIGVPYDLAEKILVLGDLP